MALSVQLLTEHTKKQPAAMSTRLPGYSSGLGSINTGRRTGPVGPNPLPKKLGSLAKGRAPSLTMSPRQPPVGVNAASVRIAKQSNSTAGTDPRPYDRNLNNVKPIREIRRNQQQDSGGSGGLDPRGDGGKTSDSSGAASTSSDDSKRNLPPALSVDFIKHALSANKQIYSPQEIKAKAETSWKPSSKASTKRPKTKASSPKENTAARIEPKEVPKSKLFESLQTEGFGPRVKSKALNGHLKVLHKRLGGESAIAEESEEDINIDSPLSSS